MNQQQIETTVIAAHTLVKGELHLSGPTVIAGRVEGAIFAEEAIEIAAEAVVEGDVQGVVIEIHGTVKGNVSASKSCRVGATAKVAGELRAANLAIAEGACFVGQVFVGGARPHETAVEEDVYETPEVTAGVVNRIEQLVQEAEEVVAAASSPVVMAPAGAANGAGPTVRVNAQAVQQTLQRQPKIIKAR